MPYYHCSKCQHEFESGDSKNKAKCDWCGARNPIILEESTPLEKMLKDKDSFITTMMNILKEFKSDK
jgi:DNA-directed RNA polymerase subunit RPC12/RpoP